MKYKLPKFVNVLGHDWKVEFADEKKVTNGAWGICIYPDRQIYILNKKMNKMMIQITLLHELRHAYQFESGSANILGNQAMELDADSFASFVTSLKKQKVI